MMIYGACKCIIDRDNHQKKHKGLHCTRHEITQHEILRFSITFLRNKLFFLLNSHGDDKKLLLQSSNFSSSFVVLHVYSVQDV
jgi:hypothetical protein